MQFSLIGLTFRLMVQSDSDVGAGGFLAKSEFVPSLAMWLANYQVVGSRLGFVALDGISPLLRRQQTSFGDNCFLCRELNASHTHPSLGWLWGGRLCTSASCCSLFGESEMDPLESRGFQLSWQL